MKQMQTEERELATLLEIGQTLARTHQLKDGLANALETLGRHHGMIRGAIMLVDTDTNDLHIEASHGINESEARRVKYRSGEGITGRVFQSGKPIVVPQTSREPLFFGSSGRSQEKRGWTRDKFYLRAVID